MTVAFLTVNGCLFVKKCCQKKAIAFSPIYLTYEWYIEFRIIRTLIPDRTWRQSTARATCVSIYNSANGKSEVVLSLTLLLREPLVFLVVSRTRTLSLIIILMKSQKGPLLYSALMYLHIQMSSQVFTFMWSKRMIYKSLYVWFIIW